VGDSGIVRTSPDGVTWTARTSGTTARLRDVIWNGSLFVAVGDSGIIRTSPDGVTWVAQTSGTASTLMGLTWSGSLFAAVGGSGTIRTSEDGTNWIVATSGTSGTMYGVAWGGNLFVALGPNGYIYTSPDGKVWTGGSGRVATSLYGIAWGNNQFIVVGMYGVIHTSPDGAAWTARHSGETQALHSVTWTGGRFVAVGEGGTILSSPDGVDWTKQPYGDDYYSTFTGVAYANGLHVVVGFNIYGNIYAASPDLKTWSARGGGLSRWDSLYAVTWADKQFVAVGDYADGSANSPIITSTNGLDWTKRESGTIQALYSVAGNGDLFVAVGANSEVLTSPNGADWTVHNVWEVHRGNLLGVAWGCNRFVAVGGAILTSPDGITWTKQVSGTSLSSVTWNGLQFVAVGSSGAVLTSPDGLSWTSRSSGCSRGLLGVTWNGSQFVAVGEQGAILSSGTAGSVAGRIISPLRSGTLVVGDTLRFSASALNDSQATYHWDFGDGRSSSVPNPGFIRYASTGEVEVVYSATVGAESLDADGRSYAVVADTGDIPDLQVTDVSLTGALAVGQPLQVQYTVQNVGQGPAGPSWRDALFLSRDPYLDTSDLLLNSVVVTQNVAVGLSYQSVMNATLPAAYAGGCYLILVADDRWEILEARRLNNEHATQVTDLAPVLVAGTSTSVPYGAGRVEQYFRMTATAGQNLLLNLAGVPSDLEVFIQFGGLPTEDGDYAYRLRGGEELLIPTATGGDWFILVRGTMSQTGAYTLRFSTKDLTLTSISPTKHEAGNSLELTLIGAGFIRPLAVKLFSGQGQVYEADQVEVDSCLQATAHFAAGTVLAGKYGVRIERNGQVTDLPAALEVTGGGQARLRTNLILPGTFGYHQLATVYVEYANIGDAPMPAPVITVTAVQNGRAGAILTLEQTRLESGFWTATMPAGFANSVQFIASGETPGILQAGESRRVPVYYAGWQQPWDFGYPPFEWHVGVIEAGNATPVDWSRIKDGMRPDYVRADAWDVLWDNFAALAGNTWGDYVAMLTRNAQYLHRQGVEVRDLESLLAFSMRLSDGISPVGRLAGASDAAVRAPGLPILFGRSFPQPISRRFELGDLGRGWTHNWRQSMQVKQDGTVVIPDQIGTPRAFYPDSRHTGRYLAQPGDQGDLRVVGDGYRLTEVDGGVLFYRSGKLEYVEDTNGNRITCQYTGGRLTRLSHSTGGYLILTYNGDGYIASVTDPQGRQTTYSYTGEYLTSVRAHDGRTTTYTYITAGAAQHALAEIASPNGNTRTYAYDDRGRLTATWRNNQEEKVTLTLGDTGRVVITDALGNASSLFFDHWARLIKTENPLGETVQMRFNELGRLLSVTDPDGGSATYAYDSKGNVTEITDCLRQTTRLLYARPFNRLSRVTDAMNRRTEYVHDDRGNLTAVVYPDGSSEGWTRDSQGKPTSWTSRRGKIVAFEHDAGGRITRKGYADGSSVVYRYDGQGRLAEAEDAYGITSFTYDEHEYLTRVTYPGNRWLALTYDTAGRRTASEDQTGHRVEYRYDASSRISRISTASGDIASYTYDTLGRLSRQTSGNGVYAEHTYDPVGRLLSLVNHLPNGDVLSRFAYTYDRRGRRTAMQTHYGVWVYTYNEAGQLTRAVLSSTNVAIPDQDLAYEYDALGNRIRTRINGVEEEYHANNLNQYTTVGGQTYAYDLDGNLVEETGPAGTTVYTYNDENRLIGVTRGTNEWHYTYDALGNRVAVDDHGAVTHFVYDPVNLGNLVAEYDDSGNVLSRYTHGLGLVSRWNSANGDGYYSYDPMGNTSELTGPTGGMQNAYAYRPFGDVVLESQVVPDAFKFMGQAGIVADTTGLSHVRWRQYDSKTGRFASVDPLGLGSGDLNFYGYAANQPTMALDPSGLMYGCAFWGSLIKTVTGGLQICSGAGLVVAGLGGTPVTGGGSLALTAFGGAMMFSGAYDLFTGSAGVGINGGAFIADRCGLLSATDRYYVDAASDALGPSLVGVGVSLLTRDWETYEYNTTAVQVADGAVDILTTGKGAVDVTVTAVKSVANISLAGYFCAHSQDPVSLPELPVTDLSKTSSRFVAPSDPNAKTGVAGFGTSNFVQAGQQLSYRIGFENFALATAPAQTVTIRDPLSASLDWSTLELGEIGFGNVTVSIPPGLQHYETVVNYEYTDEDYDFVIAVHVEAWLESGTLCVNFFSIDPDTGLPPTVDIGFLMPETEPATGRGQGYVSYLIRPKTGIPSGTAIRNVATIQFDFGEKIETNQVDPHDSSKGTDPGREALVTIDADPPTSAVAPLPNQAGPTFLVEWSGLDDPAGSGLKDYDVYVIENGTNQYVWQSGTVATNAWFRGQSGATYAFSSVARDNVGQEETFPAIPHSVTTVPTNAPVLSGVTPFDLEAGQVLNHTNVVSGTPAGSWSFNLEEPFPAGVTLNPTNGVLRWALSCANASTTNIITVWVTDTGNTNLTDAIRYTVVVGECVVPSLGQIVLRTGEGGGVPVNLISAVPLTNLTMTVEGPTERLRDFWVEPIVPEICTNFVAPLSNSLHLLSLTTCQNQWLIGTQQVAWLHFTAASNQSSAFVHLKLDNISGFRPDGSSVLNFAPQSGRVVIVGAEPLLEALCTVTNQVLLLQYALPDWTVFLEWTTNLPPSGWQRSNGVIQTNLVQQGAVLPPNGSSLFFRAVRQ
jgi:RHS repeat-associated protein